MLWKELIAGRLREARIKAGLSQEELAEAVGLTAVSISKFETGRRQPRVSTVERVAEATGIPLSWFFSEGPEPISKDFHRRLAEQILGFLEQEHLGIRALLGTFSESLPALAWTTDDRLNITGRFGDRWEGKSGLSLFGTGTVLAHRQALRGVTSAFRFSHQGLEYAGRVRPLPSGDGRINGTLAVAVELPAGDASAHAGAWKSLEPPAEGLSQEESAEQQRSHRRSQARSFFLATLVEQMESGFAVQMEERITYANPSLCKLLDYPPDSLVGFHLRDLVVQEEQARLASLIERRKFVGAENYGLVLRRKDGRRVACRIRSTPIVNGEGAATGSFAVITRAPAADHLDLLLWTVNSSGEVTSLSGGSATSSRQPDLLSHPAILQATRDVLRGGPGESFRVESGGQSYLVQVGRTDHDEPGAAGVAVPDLTQGTSSTAERALSPPKG